MEVEVKIKATAEELFSLLMDSVKHDIKQSTGKDVKTKELVSGYTYSKNLTNKLGKEGAASGVLTIIEPPFVYEAAFTSSRGVNRLSYKLVPLADGMLNVTYTEIYEPINRNSELNFKFVNFFYRKSFKKRITHMIKMMEAHLQQKSVAVD